MSRTPDDPRCSLVTITHANFEFAIADVREILRQYDSRTDHRSGRASRQSEVLKRAAVILSVTAWESFIEDSLRDRASAAINTAARPMDLQSLFNSVAHDWLERTPKPPGLADWTGDGWKTLLRNKLESDILTLNTPNSQHVRVLSKRYLGEDITTRWRWEGTTPAQAARRLDSLMRLRGDVAHHGREAFKRAAAITRKQAVQAISLVERLVESTERALGTAPRPFGD